MAQAVLDAIVSKFGDAVLETSTAFGDECATVKADKLVEIATFLKDDPKMAFDSPIFVTCIDRLGLPNMEHRFEVAIQLRSLPHRHRLRLKVPIDEKTMSCPSLAVLGESGSFANEFKSLQTSACGFVVCTLLRWAKLSKEVPERPNSPLPEIAIDGDCG